MAFSNAVCDPLSCFLCPCSFPSLFFHVQFTCISERLRAIHVRVNRDRTRRRSAALQGCLERSVTVDVTTGLLWRSDADLVGFVGSLVETASVMCEHWTIMIWRLYVACFTLAQPVRERASSHTQKSCASLCWSWVLVVTFSVAALLFHFLSESGLSPAPSGAAPFICPLLFDGRVVFFRLLLIPIPSSPAQLEFNLHNVRVQAKGATLRGSQPSTET